VESKVASPASKNMESALPSQLAAYEGILQRPKSPNEAKKSSSNLYDGVFSAKTFEILVPHNQ